MKTQKMINNTVLSAIAILAYMVWIAQALSRPIVTAVLCVCIICIAIVWFLTYAPEKDAEDSQCSKTVNNDAKLKVKAINKERREAYP